MEQNVRIILLGVLGLTLIGLLAYVFFWDRSDCNNSMDNLVKCIHAEKTPALPEKAPVAQMDQQAITRKIEQIQQSPAKKTEPPKTTQSTKSKQKKKIKLQKQVSAKDLEKSLRKKMAKLDLKKDLQKRLEKQRRRERAEQRKRAREAAWKLPTITTYNFNQIESGFNYALNSLFLALPLIALGMAMGPLSLKGGMNTYALLALGTVLAALVTGDTILSNYNFLGPYMFILGGASLLIPAESRESALPAIGFLIGGFLGFTTASDAPVDHKWWFVIGAILAAGFLLLFFAMASRLFNQTWLGYAANVLGGGLIAVALVMFAMELNGGKA